MLADQFRSEMAERERHLRRVLPELSDRHIDFLHRFREREAGDLPSTKLARDYLNTERDDLERLGFIAAVASIDKLYSLYELTPPAANVVPGYVADYRRKKIGDALRAAKEPEKTLLFLFADPKELSDAEPLDDWMPRDVYEAISKLESSWVVTVEGGLLRRLFPAKNYRLGVTLTDDAIPIVEDLILGGKIGRKTLVLDMAKVEGTGSSGGGGGGGDNEPNLI